VLWGEERGQVHINKEPAPFPLLRQSTAGCRNCREIRCALGLSPIEAAKLQLTQLSSRLQTAITLQLKGNAHAIDLRTVQHCHQRCGAPRCDSDVNNRSRGHGTFADGNSSNRSFRRSDSAKRDPFAISGVSFTGAGITLTSGIDVAPSGSPVFSVQSPTDAVTITFPQNVKAAGAYFIVSGASTNADLMVDVFDNVTLLGTHRLFDSTSATRTFFGASSTQPFNKLHFRNAALNGVSFLMDDVTYAFVPEPTTLIQVVALGALAPFVRGRRRSDSHPVA
jgi:hypothetical protein